MVFISMKMMAHYIKTESSSYFKEIRKEVCEKCSLNKYNPDNKDSKTQIS